MKSDKKAENEKKFYDSCRVKTGNNFQLSRIAPQDTPLVSFEKKEAVAELKKLNVRLDELQELLYAESKYKILIILQGMDTSGKDGTIRDVFAGVNPQGVKVKSFKVPTSEELAHDFLWRVHQATPANGDIVIFNRSHYEDVLIVRVHDLIKKNVWQRRYDHINDFERMLTEEGTVILKFFLYISKDEQKKRLQDRLDDCQKHWKFRVTDLKERKLWPKYMKAYNDMLPKTSTPHAPWYIIPADHKWYRNFLIASIIVNALQNLKMNYPQSPNNLKGVKVV